MANKVLLKRSSVAGKVPLTTDLDWGEVSVNYADGVVWYKNSANTVVRMNSAVNGTTVGGVAYLGGSNVLVNGTGLTFDSSANALTVTGNLIAGTWQSSNLNSINQLYGNLLVGRYSAFADGTDTNVVFNFNNAVPVKSNATIQVIGLSGKPTTVLNDSFGSAYSVFCGRKSRGTAAAPTAAQTGDLLAVFQGQGHGQTCFTFAAVRTGMQIYAAENFDDTKQGTILTLATNPIGGNGAITGIHIGPGGSSGGNVVIPSSTLSSGFYTNTGALVVPNGDVLFGANLYVTQDTQIDQRLWTRHFSTANAVITGGSVNGLSYLQVTNFSTGNLVVTGGYITGLANVTATQGTFTNLSSPNVVINGGYISALTNATITTATLTTVKSDNYQFANGSPFTFTSTSLANTAEITANVSSGTVGLSLAATGVVAGNYGSATSIPTVVVDSKGRISSITTNAVSTTITLAGGSGSGSVAGGGTLTIAGTSNQISTSVSGSTVTLSLPSEMTVPGNFTVAGNLTIQGNTVTIGSNNLTINDSIIDLHTWANLGALTSDDGRDIGIRFHYYKTSDKHAFLGWDNTTGALEYYSDATETSSAITGTRGNVIFGSMVLSNTTAATSATTGALQVSGGIGVSGDIYTYKVNASHANILTAGYFGSLNTANAVISGGYISSLTNATITTTNITTERAANFSSPNAVISGGYISSLTNASITTTNIGTENATNFSTANAVITGGYISGLSNLSVSGNIVASANTTLTGNTYIQSNVQVTGQFRAYNNSPGISGQVLASTGTGIQWVNANTLPTAGGALSTLSDVALSSPQVQQVLTYNGTQWVNADSNATVASAIFATSQSDLGTVDDLVLVISEDEGLVTEVAYNIYDLGVLSFTGIIGLNNIDQSIKSDYLGYSIIFGF